MKLDEKLLVMLPLHVMNFVMSHPRLSMPLIGLFYGFFIISLTGQNTRLFEPPKNDFREELLSRAGLTLERLF